MRSFKGFLLFFLLILLFGYFTLWRKRSYPIYAIIENVHSVESQARVMLDGKEVGRIDHMRMLDPHRVLLKLSIDDGVQIASSDAVTYRETLLGDAEVDIVGSRSSSRPVQALDTLLGTFAMSMHKVDSSDRKKIVDRLEDLGRTLDTIAKKHASGTVK